MGRHRLEDKKEFIGFRLNESIIGLLKTKFKLTTEADLRKFIELICIEKALK